MKKGSKAVRCCKCKQIIGWDIPTGRTHHGIPEVEIRLNDNGCEVSKGFIVRYYCTDCKPERR